MEEHVSIAAIKALPLLQQHFHLPLSVDAFEKF
jgi:hypothetical protein